MPNQHKAPMLGWHPPAELSAWARAEAKRRDVPLKVILDEALAAYRENVTRQLAAAQAPPGQVTVPTPAIEPNVAFTEN